MTIYITRSDNSSPVAVKPGGSAQGRIGKAVEITVIRWEKGYAQFIDPVVIPNSENWIDGRFITEVVEPPPVDPPPVEPPDETIIVIRINLAEGKVYVNDQSFPI